MAKPDIQFSFRLPKELHDRLIGVVAATGNEITRSGLCVQALEFFLHNLSAYPAMVEGYDPQKDKSARQAQKRKCKKEKSKTEAEESCARK